MTVSAEDLKTAVANYASAEIALDYQRAGALIDIHYQKDDKGEIVIRSMIRSNMDLTNALVATY